METRIYTETEEKLFLNEYLKIIQSNSKLKELGVSEKDICFFLTKSGKEKVIYKSKFYFDADKMKFVLESNFPNYFDLFELVKFEKTRKFSKKSKKKN